jgi:hypothetical protein
VGGSVTLRRMFTVKFAPDAADYFVENRAEAFTRQVCLLCRPRPSQAGAVPMESMMRDGHRPRSHHAPIEARGEALQNRDDEGDRRSVDLDPLASELLEG